MLGQLHGAEALHSGAGLIGVPDVLLRHLVQAEALAGDDIDEAVLAQAHQRVLHGRAGDVDLRRHLRLGIEHVGLQLSRQDLVADIVIGRLLDRRVLGHARFLLLLIISIIAEERSVSRRSAVFAARGPAGLPQDPGRPPGVFRDRGPKKQLFPQKIRYIFVKKPD